MGYFVSGEGNITINKKNIEKADAICKEEMDETLIEALKMRGYGFDDDGKELYISYKSNEKWVTDEEMWGALAPLVEGEMVFTGEEGELWKYGFDGDGAEMKSYQVYEIVWEEV